jgi:sulfate/thiosulfate-binding protein
MRTPKLIPLLLLPILAVLAAGCGSSSSSDSKKVAIVAYSTPQDAFEAAIAGFQKTADGKGVSFTQSYGPSGDQSRAVLAGQSADLVDFSLETDLTKLVDAGLVDKSWNANPTKGILTDSVVALVVRKGNPKGIKTWDDLLKPGIQVITPNPFSSGSARWNIMAAYGQAIEQGKSPAEATAYLTSLFKHVPVQPKSGRDALQTFTGGKGDVLISYENEAIGAQQKGQKVDYVIPDQTLLIENPAAVLKKASAKAKTFLAYLHTTAGQKAFVSKGYRSTIPSLNGRFPTPKQLFTIRKFGGWPTVAKKFFDPDNSVVATIETGRGVSTSG